MKAADVVVDEVRYRVAHGVPPMGDGFWVFMLTTEAEFCQSSKYSVAKAAARVRAAELNLPLIRLLP